MKKIVLLMVFAFIGVLSTSASTTNDIATIRKFYTEYCSALAYEKKQPFREDVIPYEKSFAVIKKYSTTYFYNYMLDEQHNGVGYDFVTDNYSLDDLSLKTLNVSSTKKDYLVTFKVHVEIQNGGSVIKTVKVRVKMLKGKINDIKGLTDK
jgi:hypothetical protein